MVRASAIDRVYHAIALSTHIGALPHRRARLPVSLPARLTECRTT